MCDLSAVERSLTPSLWSKRQNVIGFHVKFTTEESRRAKSELQCRLGCKYGKKETEKIDIFHDASLASTSPMFVYFTGGYWTDLSGDISSYVAFPFAASGSVVAIPHYDRAPGMTLTCIVDQVQRSIIWLLNENEGKRRVILAGHSVGAQLIISALTTMPKEVDLGPIVALGLFGGVYDLEPCLGTTLAQPVGLSKDDVEKYSPLKSHNLTRFAEKVMEKVDVMLFAAENDAPELVKQSGKYFQALSRFATKNVSLETLPNLDHFNLVEKISEYDYGPVVKMIAALHK